ncbi:hypothetical protein AgCh_025912 [Apium graveolens]
MVDAVYSALEKADASSLDVVVSETGWPTAGGPQATAYNARLYNNNLIKRRAKWKGTEGYLRQINKPSTPSLLLLSYSISEAILNKD